MSELWNHRDLSWEQGAWCWLCQLGTPHGSGILASFWARDCPLACSFGHLEGGGDPGNGLVKVAGRFLLWCRFQKRQYNFDIL